MVVKQDAKVWVVEEISEHMHNSLEVRDSRLLHELAKMLDCEGQIRPCMGKKIEFANNFPVKGRVFKESPICGSELLGTV